MEDIGIGEEKKSLGPEYYREKIKLACIDKLKEKDKTGKVIVSTTLSTY